MLFLITFIYFALAINSFPSPGSSGIAPEPWPPLSGGSFSGLPAPQSPDPLIQYVWPLDAVNDTILQIYQIPAVAISLLPGTETSAFTNISSAVESIACEIHVIGNGTLVIDFGVELAGWIELDVMDLLDIDVNGINIGIGEYSGVEFVGQFKRAVPVKYGTNCDISLCTYRLETNPVGPELYEGVRFAFFTLTKPPSQPFTIKALRAVGQAKPMNYIGAFSSPGDNILERIWYSGAYTVRATAQSDYMGSILINRGDRIGWVGDLHTTQVTSMTVFANYQFVQENLNRTSCPDCCNGIATYCLYFVLSAVDYFDATGDKDTLIALSSAISSKLDKAAILYPHPHGLRFVGHDDRLGNGFCNPDTNETEAVYRFLAIRAWASYARVASMIGDTTASLKYTNLSQTAISALRSGQNQPWWNGLGVHAVAEALAGLWATPSEAAAASDAKLGNIVTAPSQSNFQTYFILLALAHSGLLDRGIQLARLAWGAPILLGATTVWEQSHPDWINFIKPGPGPIPNEAGWSSLAHPWSSGVTAWLSAYILGIRYVENDSDHLIIAPHVTLSMKRFGLQGRVPIRGGGIVTLFLRASLILPRVALIDITLPIGQDAQVIFSAKTLRRLGVTCAKIDDIEIFKEELRVPVMIVKGHTASPRKKEQIGGGEDRADAIVLLLKGGLNHSLLARCTSLQIKDDDDDDAAADEAPPFPPPAWPSYLLRTDYKTRGNWQGSYGNAGYFFPAYSTTSVLPPWVNSITIWGSNNSGFNGAEFAWNNINNNDIRALSQPQAHQALGRGGEVGSNSSSSRFLGAAAPQGSGSFPLDIIVNDESLRWQLSLYYCDYGATPWGDGEFSEIPTRQQEVYLLTLPTLDPAAPRNALSNFSQGVWMIYNVQGSIRVRTTTIRGDYAVLSAVLFDLPQ